MAQQLAESANEDAQKGRDIRIQQRLYDTLLDVLIRFQKALLALNSLPQGSSVEKYSDDDTEAALKIAKQEALNMFALTLDLRTVHLLGVNLILAINTTYPIKWSSISEAKVRRNLSDRSPRNIANI